MTDYTITTNFGAKDILNTGDSGKVIKGAEFTTEFEAIRTAVNSKANSDSPTFSGTATLPTANITTLNLSGAEVTSSAAEINTLDGFTGSVDDLNYAKDLRASGVTAGEYDTLSGVTASTAELNLLHGVTASTDEINLLDGVTATTDELNILDGVTATTAELNYVDGVTSNVQTQLDAKMPKEGGTFSNDVTFANNVNLNMGTNSEMQIVRTDTASIIQDVGSGSIFILSNGEAIVLGKDSPFERCLRALPDAGVELYYDTTLTAETTSDGFEVVGVTDTDKLRVTAPTVPASASATGTAGEISWDADYIYVCTATDTWKRVAIATW